jgi:hypothetical protein
MRLSLVLCCAATVLSAHAQQTRQNETGAVFEGQTRLATDQITEMFSNVIDRGEVQDGRGISAETHWFADGTFVSRWWTEAHDASAEGAVEHEVTGRWRTERDLRCVTFGSKLSPIGRVLRSGYSLMDASSHLIRTEAYTAFIDCLP